MNPKYTLEKSNYSNMKCIKMLCDKPLSNKRTIKPPFLNNKGFMMICVGKPGSGKSTFLFSMLTNKNIYKKIFTNILYVCPSNSRASVKDNPLADLDDNHLFDNLGGEVQEQIHTNKEEYDDKPEKNQSQLLIIDDCTAYLKDNDNILMLGELAMNRRHLNLSIILLVQYVVSIPPVLRSQYNAIVIFKPVKKDYERINKEFLFMKKDEFINFIDYVFKNKHDNLFINVDNDNDYYKNLQKIIIND